MREDELDRLLRDALATYALPADFMDRVLERIGAIVESCVDMDTEDRG
jgi:hypothetical protein